MKSLYEMTDDEVIGMVMENSNISFALNYKDVDKEGKMEEMVAAVKSLQLAAQSLGYGTMLKRR